MCKWERKKEISKRRNFSCNLLAFTSWWQRFRADKSSFFFKNKTITNLDAITQQQQKRGKQNMFCGFSIEWFSLQFFMLHNWKGKNNLKFLHFHPAIFTSIWWQTQEKKHFESEEFYFILIYCYQTFCSLWFGEKYVIDFALRWCQLKFDCVL